MAQVARSQGCTISLTTNGMNLTEAMQMQVLEHLDMMAVSLDGARAETYERLRPGADFRRVTQQVAALCSRKRALGTQRPEVVLLFMKMRPNIAELPGFLQFATELGVDRVNATNLDFIATTKMEGLNLISPGPPSQEIAGVLGQAQQHARKMNISFRNIGLGGVSDLIVCDANPLENVFVTASGDLAPCVYLGLPVSGDFSRQFFQKSFISQNYLYGNIWFREIAEICQQPAYQEFTAVFRNRVAAHSRLMDNLVPKPPDTSHQGGSSNARLISEPRSPWPRFCRGCYKTLGF